MANAAAPFSQNRLHRSVETSSLTGDTHAVLQVVVGDMLKLEDVEGAAKGAELMFFCFPVKEGLLEATTIAAIAAKNARMRGVVNLSQWCAKLRSHSPHSRKHALSEAVRIPSPLPRVPKPRMAL